MEFEILVAEGGHFHPWSIADAPLDHARFRALGRTGERDASIQDGLRGGRSDARGHAAEVHDAQVGGRHVTARRACSGEEKGVVLVLVHPIVVEGHVKVPRSGFTARFAPVEQFHRVAGTVPVLFQTHLDFGVGPIVRVLHAALEPHSVTRKKQASILVR